MLTNVIILPVYPTRNNATHIAGKESDKVEPSVPAATEARV